VSDFQKVHSYDRLEAEIKLNMYAVEYKQTSVW